MFVYMNDILVLGASPREFRHANTTQRKLHFFGYALPGGVFGQPQEECFGSLSTCEILRGSKVRKFSTTTTTWTLCCPVCFVAFDYHNYNEDFVEGRMRIPPHKRLSFSYEPAKLVSKSSLSLRVASSNIGKVVLLLVCFPGICLLSDTLLTSVQRSYVARFDTVCVGPSEVKEPALLC